MDFNYNRYYGAFVRDDYNHPEADYQFDPDLLNFGINYSGNVAAIWVGSNSNEYAYCELTTDTELSFGHSIGNLTGFSVNSDVISLNSPLVNCDNEINATLGTFVNVSANLGTFVNLSAPYKLFDIQHPSKQGKRLRHACIEGPEIAVYLRGRLYDDFVITLPDYWNELIDPETINVSLTQIGESQDLAVESIGYPEIFVKSHKGATINCYYLITATRKDVSELEIEVDE